ncbi:hypothetical protein VT06_16215 [Arsukibacterium sp. MJ3]|nr:hypothetical protein VT06_16215 [Arsukibacterium sp. MJ3]
MKALSFYFFLLLGTATPLPPPDLLPVVDGQLPPGPGWFEAGLDEFDFAMIISPKINKLNGTNISKLILKQL